MAHVLDYEAMAAMLRAAAQRVAAQYEELSRLDAHAGDGDHGTTMKRAMGLVAKAVEACASRDLKTLANDVAWALLGVDGGATGPLLGSFFMGIADAIPQGAALDAAGAAAAFEAGLAGVRQQTKAQPGDKTMIDALVPAVGALREAANAGLALPAAFARAADKAEGGAASTKDMQARFGRARNLGERSKGSCDAGATSMSLIFRGFADALQS